MAEKCSDLPKQAPKFDICYFSGKIEVPKLDAAPPELDHLLHGADKDLKDFQQHIHNYNNALAITSVRCEVDETINHNGGGL